MNVMSHHTAASGPATHRSEAIRELQGVTSQSLPAAISSIVQIAARGTGAKHVSFWRIAGDQRSLRLFCRANPRSVMRVAADGLRINTDVWIEQVLHDSRLSSLHRANGETKAVSKLLATEGSEHVFVLPIRLLGGAHGLLVVEFPILINADALELESFLQLVAARIEIAYLSEPAASRLRQTQSAQPDGSLRQSHLTLNDGSLRDLFYFAPTAMILTELEDARPVAANRHALELFGISNESTEETRTQQFWDDSADRDRFLEMALAHGFVRGYRARLKRANGNRFWARVSATAIDYDGKASLISSITDVSDSVAAEEILNRTQQTLTTLLEASPFPLVVTQLDSGVVRYCNQRAADMFDTPVSGLLGHTAPEFYVNPADRNYFVEKLRSTGRVDGFVARLKTTGGQPFWAMLHAKTLEMNGETVFMVSFADVTRQKNKEQELESLAFKDVLTDAYNRRYFIEAAQIELARSARSERRPVIALLDIDHFKHVNDTWGHDTGDEVLREFVKVVSGLLRKPDILARYGGEEFAVLLPETDIATASAIIDRIRSVVSEHPFVCRDANISVTFSAGIAAPGEEGSGNYGTLLTAADRALYSAKRGGRNCIAAITAD